MELPMMRWQPRSIGRRARRYILPSFEERTAYGYKRQDPYAKLFEDRIIFLGVQVDDASADDIMAQLLVLESHGPRPRHRHVHQLARWLVHGHDGDLRHDAVHPSADPDGRARPGGLGRGGHRSPPARPASASPCRTPASSSTSPRPAASGGGQASDIEIQAAEVLRMRTWLEETLAQHSNKTPRAGQQATSSATRSWAPQEALEYGLIDQVLTLAQEPAGARSRS